MAGARFDILFSGELLANVSPDEARRRLQQRFKLSDADANRLFDGHTHIVKHAVDTAATARYRGIFRDAGALIEVRPVAASPELFPSRSAKGSQASRTLDPDDGKDSTTSAPPSRQSAPPVRPPGDDLPQIDTSHLSLVEGSDWTLEDCQPPPLPAKLPDTSHLELVKLAPDDDTASEN